MSMSRYCCWIRIVFHFQQYNHDFGYFVLLYSLISSTTASLLEVKNNINPMKCLWIPWWKCRYSREVTFLLFRLALLQCLQITKYVSIFAYLPYNTWSHDARQNTLFFNRYSITYPFPLWGMRSVLRGFLIPLKTFFPGKKSHCRWKGCRKEKLLWDSVREMCSVSVYFRMNVITVLQLST